MGLRARDRGLRAGYEDRRPDNPNTLFMSNNFDFICNNNKQVYLVKMNPFMLSQYFFVADSIDRSVKETTRDTQLLKLSVKVFKSLLSCSTLINLSSVYFNPNFLCKNKDSYTWFPDCCNGVVFVIKPFKNQNFMEAFENFYTFIINFWEIDDRKHLHIC